MNSFGQRLRMQIFGESHGVGVGCVLDGLPAGLPFSEPAVARAMALRRPGHARTSTRQEADLVRVMSGVHDGHATGAPMALWIENQDARSQDYPDLARTPRPGHADWTSHVASRGFADLRGGGHLSGRLTAPLVAAGAVVEPLLAHHGIHVGAHVTQVGNIVGPSHAHSAAAMAEALVRPSRTAHQDLEDSFLAAIDAARKDRDSVGGVVEFAVEGLPGGLGDPWFAGLESHLAQILFAIPAAKGVDFGSGFGAAAMRGSTHNDAFAWSGDRVRTTTNHAGGILGGRSTGETLRGRVAVKPAATLPGRPQETVDLQGGPATLTMGGRHDACIALRAAPVVQAAVRFAVADLVMLAQQDGILQAPQWRRP